jgi:hypothetical protein
MLLPAGFRLCDMLLRRRSRTGARFHRASRRSFGQTARRARRRPKGAADLLRRHGTLEDILAAGRFPTQAKMLRLYRSIATMNASAPLPLLENQTPTWAKAAALVSNWGLKQLADRLSKLADERPTGS